MTDREVGELIKNRRMELHLSMEDIANQVGINKSTVCRWESGEIKTIKRSHICLLSQILYIPIEILVGIDTTEKLISSDIINARNKIINKVNKIEDKQELKNIEKYIDTFILQ